MIQNPNLVFYACIAKGSIILAEFMAPDEAGVDTIAQRCIEKAPAHHSIFSHTIRKRTYTFLMDDPFVYFAIFDENIEKLESFSFLNRVKSAFEEHGGSNRMKDEDKPTSLCFQGQFLSTFREIFSMDVGSGNPSSEESLGGRNLSMESEGGGGKSPVAPLVEPPKLLMKKKKKKSSGEANGDLHVKDGGDVNQRVNNFVEGLDREFTVPMMQKSGGKGGLYSADGKQKAKQIWRKHVWVVLILDLFVCAVLFGVWLWVCRGFECIDG